MSPMISKFEKKGLIEKTLSKTDSRVRYIRLIMIRNKLIRLALDFCREKGYAKVFLLTITAQVVARHVYETHGFYKVWSMDKSEWGEGVIEERRDLELS